MELRTYAILLLTILQTQAAQSRYVLTQVYAGNNFTAGFNFRSVSALLLCQAHGALWSEPMKEANRTRRRQAADYDGGDPTGGFVNYLPYRDASSAGLVQVLNGTQVYVGADHTKTLSRSAQGRDSVRLESKQSFDYGLLVADIAHMPGNQCGIWPAL
ncbi:hypothetical protein VTK73DRAFT_282 [Phialemonium thermophilum]|uniref:Uncharacterized protein n=1 Tax=Phialemonium thermophilum TaxID=223376 RepID=A0ABR3VVX8_9PEZI